MSYEAVFLDLCGVIIELKSIREGYALFIGRLAAEYDLPSDALDRWRSALGDYFSGREGTEYCTAHEGYRVATRELFDGSPPPESVWRETFETASEETTRSVDGAVETVRAAASGDTHVGVVSDIDTDRAHALLAQFGVADCFDAVTTSEAVGYTKPDADVRRRARRVGR